MPVEAVTVIVYIVLTASVYAGSENLDGSKLDVVIEVGRALVPMVTDQT